MQLDPGAGTVLLRSWQLALIRRGYSYAAQRVPFLSQAGVPWMGVQATYSREDREVPGAPLAAIRLHNYPPPPPPPPLPGPCNVDRFRVICMRARTRGKKNVSVVVVPEPVKRVSER